MSVTELILCPDLFGSKWQLGARKSGLLGIGWAVHPAPVDGGVPDIVADVLSQAMAKMGRVAFLADGRRKGSGDGSLYPAKRRSYLGLLPLLFGRKRLALRFTSRAAEIRSSFDDPAFPIEQQGQLYLFLGEGTADFVIDEDCLVRLTSDSWTEVVAELSGLGVVAAARPGVDGDLLGFFSTRPEITDRFLRALVEAASLGHVKSRIVEDDDFTLALSAS